MRKTILALHIHHCDDSLSRLKITAAGCYRVAMDPLYWRAIIHRILGTFLFIAVIFWPAGRFHYWQGWLFLAVFSASTMGFTMYLALYDKPLLERRLAAGPQHEKERSQKIIVSLIFIAFFALIV